MTIPVQELPFYLQQYVAKQDYDQYTAIDQSTWRFILRISKLFFKEHGHPDYLNGLEETGISTEAIPRISDIDEKLKKLGWRAVVVTGFIPSESFMELLSLGVLPIACDMRKLEHLDYTPAPDIVHEAAGHAPMLANFEFASALRKFGEVSRKVIFSKEDSDVYRSVLKLSEIKEDPHSTPQQVADAQKALEKSLSEVSYVSEAQRLSRFAWWSTEYGLFKNKDRYLIFGAGLLSSIGESYSCLSKEVEKIPFDIRCVEKSFDITRPQPQLYYVNSFKEMESVVDELSKTMAYKIGGREGLEKAFQAQTITTTELNSGIQIGGIVESFLFDDQNHPLFIKWSGPVQLGFQGKQIENQGPSVHKTGFSSCFGKIKNKNLLLDLKPGVLTTLEFESGFIVQGVFKSQFKSETDILILTFTKAQVEYKGTVYFEPSWGDFDLALGTEIVSVFGGAPDRGQYYLEMNFKKETPRKQNNNLTDTNRKLNELYLRFQKLSKNKEPQSLNEEGLRELSDIKKSLDQLYPSDWLLRLEILEFIKNRSEFKAMESALLLMLEQIGQESERVKTLISRGLKLMGSVGH